MFANSAWLVIGIILIWVGLIAYYLITSARQKEIASELEELTQLVEKKEAQEL